MMMCDCMGMRARILDSTGSFDSVLSVPPPRTSQTAFQARARISTQPDGSVVFYGRNVSWTGHTGEKVDICQINQLIQDLVKMSAG